MLSSEPPATATMMMMLMANEAMKMVMMSRVEAAGHWAEESKVSLGSKCHFSFLSP